MDAIVKPAGVAALLIFLAFLMHSINALYIEPQILGFEDPRVDYAKVEKLQNAMGSIPWMLSGFGHIISGFAAVILGFAGHALFVDARPLAGRLALAAGAIAGAGFLLTGIADVMGGQVLRLLAAQNADQTNAIYLAGSVMRVSFNGLAIVAMGWFAVILSWCGLKTGRLPKGFSYFGFLAGISGLMLAVIFIPLYLQLYLIWSLWLGILLLRMPA